MHSPSPGTIPHLSQWQHCPSPPDRILHSGGIVLRRRDGVLCGGSVVLCLCDGVFRGGGAVLCCRDGALLSGFCISVAEVQNSKSQDPIEMGLASGSTSIPESIRTESLEVYFGNYTMIKMEKSSGFPVLFGGENSNPPDDGGKDKILGLQLSARLQNNGLKDKIFLGLELIARLQHRTRASGSKSIPESIRTESLEVYFGNCTMIKMEESSGFPVLFGGENSNPPDDGGKDKILGLQLSARLQNNGLKDKIFQGLEPIARLQHRTRATMDTTGYLPSFSNDIHFILKSNSKMATSLWIMDRAFELMQRSDIIIQGLTILPPVDSPNTDGIDPGDSCLRKNLTQAMWDSILDQSFSLVRIYVMRTLTSKYMSSCYLLYGCSVPLYGIDSYAFDISL
ncbi:hypothetical protein JHK87_052578 [Glycine soja]|nr:hypothetical protein JHK87_052578 [Glycine soja]